MDNHLFIYLSRIERLFMFSKYAHVKGFALSNSLLCHSMVFFNPLTYSMYPLTSYLQTKFLNPLTNIFLRSARVIMFWGCLQNSIRLCQEYPIIYDKWNILAVLNFCCQEGFVLHITPSLEGRIHDLYRL